MDHRFSFILGMLTTLLFSIIMKYLVNSIFDVYYMTVKFVTCITIAFVTFKITDEIIDDYISYYIEKRNNRSKSIIAIDIFIFLLCLAVAGNTIALFIKDLIDVVFR